MVKDTFQKWVLPPADLITVHTQALASRKVMTGVLLTLAFLPVNSQSWHNMKCPFGGYEVPSAVSWSPRGGGQGMWLWEGEEGWLRLGGVSGPSAFSCSLCFPNTFSFAEWSFGHCLLLRSKKHVQER